MGIPSYLSYIIRNYPGIVRAFNGSHAQKFDHMYFDSNSIVYDAYRQLQENTDAVINDTTIIDKVILQLEHLISQICPKHNIFIALDGVAPFAKITQQRQRRFKSAATATTHSKESFSTIKITPGTEFMKMLTFRLTRHFSGRGGNVIISGSDIPGEGEHKIFKHIRETNKNATDTYVIYGLDADLIMLSINHLYISKNIYIFRETPDFHETTTIKNVPYTILDISKLSRTIELHTGADAQSYIFLCFLLGNDFLPHFPVLNLRTNGMDLLLESYKKNIGKSKLINNGRIQWRILSKLLRDIALSEPDLFIKQTHDRNKLEKKYALRAKLHSATSRFCGDAQHRSKIEILRSPKDVAKSSTPQNIEDGIDPELHNPVVYRELEKYICPEEEGWETRYYRVLFGGAEGAQSNNDISKICLNLLYGLEWTFKYYCGNCVDWRWKYNYHYAPLLSDFVKYIPQFETEFFNDEAASCSPLHPNVQLACVLPRKYLYLLPTSIREHIEKKYLSLYTTTNINTIWAYCRYNWEGHLVLPEITPEFLDDITALV